jgi:hypothetical protein
VTIGRAATLRATAAVPEMSEAEDERLRGSLLDDPVRLPSGQLS